VGEFVANAAILFGIKALNCDAVCFSEMPPPLLLNIACNQNRQM
jgi:hypothetical protein